jgi:hypothetical protein
MCIEDIPVHSLSGAEQCVLAKVVKAQHGSGGRHAGKR